MVVRKKRRKGNGATEEPPSIAADDLISSLPDEIIHKILGRLNSPKQAALTSALSRRWLNLWRSYPVVEFRSNEFNKSAAGQRKFSRFAASARKLWKRRTPLDALRLSLAIITKPAQGILARLLASALRADGGSPLEVEIGTTSFYKIPEGLLSNCSRTRVLKIKGCNLNALGTVSLHSLQVLNLSIVRITDQILHYILENAPNLESLSLSLSGGIERLEVSARNFPKLKTLEIHTGGYVSELELLLSTAPFLERLDLTEGTKPWKLRILSLSSAPNLKFLKITNFDSEEIVQSDHVNDFITMLPSLRVLEIFGRESHVQVELHPDSPPTLKTLPIIISTTMCKMNIVPPFLAPYLKDLYLSFAIGITQRHLDDLISKLPCLESLSLNLDNGSNCESNKMKLRSDRLKKFRLSDWNRNERDTLQELEIDAPNLVDIIYFGSMLRFPGKIDVVSVGSNCQFDIQGVGFPLISARLTYEWFSELRQSFSALSSFHLIMGFSGLDLSQQVSFDLGQVECSFPPLIVQSLRLGFTLAASPNYQSGNPNAVIQDVQNSVTFLNGLFWACRPKFICIAQFSDVDRWFAEVICEQLTNRDVANCCVGAKCWRHELRDVKIGNASHEDMKISKNEVLPLAKDVNVEISFVLTWC
ncbi:unnamed protein product [Linum tenue]|uniref:F-box domain-containing protein n=1 Tax=Linum tenue TaxID=586396 RepID=A0AAV0QG29_9ROSI|nr:unnamed protein product [Linum tenue]